MTYNPKKHKLLICWDENSSSFLEENGVDITLDTIEKQLLTSEQVKEWSFTIKEFSTKRELLAYIKGVEDGNGWIKPCYAEIKVIEK